MQKLKTWYESVHLFILPYMNIHFNPPAPSGASEYPMTIGRKREKYSLFLSTTANFMCKEVEEMGWLLTDGDFIKDIIAIHSTEGVVFNGFTTALVFKCSTVLSLEAVDVAENKEDVYDLHIDYMGILDNIMNNVERGIAGCNQK